MLRKAKLFGDFFFFLITKVLIPNVICCTSFKPKWTKDSVCGRGSALPTDEYISALACEYVSVWDPDLQALIVGLWFSVDFVPNKEKVEQRF